MRPSVTVGADPLTLSALLSGWVAANRVLMARRPLPPLYASGVRYRREPRGRERWQLAPETYRRGVGDCEDLATWRAAELQLAGIDAQAAVYQTNRRGQLHVVVALPDGSVEDPSRVLGMGWRG